MRGSRGSAYAKHVNVEYYIEFGRDPKTVEPILFLVFIV